MTDPSRGVRLRSQAFAAGAVTSLVSFWLLVRAVAADSATQVQNVVLVLASAAVLMLVVALWFPPSRAAVLGAVGGMLSAGVAVLGLAAAFGR